jgi:hypothetical protein
MRRESEGFDHIFVDELQLFDSQERLAIALLGRSSTGVPLTSAEDPSQGMFSTLNARSASMGMDQSVYLESIHRFEAKIFEFIKFVYQKFPLNTIALRIDNKNTDASPAPTAILTDSDESAINWAAHRAQKLLSVAAARDARICVVTLGDVEDALRQISEALKLPIVQLRSFDDVEQLSYTRKSVILSPWQFIGGTQFSHVIVVAAGVASPTTAFARLRELTSIYLACSRAVTSLDIICGARIPQVVREAIDAGLLTEKRV